MYGTQSFECVRCLEFPYYKNESVKHNLSSRQQYAICADELVYQ